MPDLALAPEPTVTSAQAAPRTLMAAVALVSFASLLLELSLTRLFSVVLFYHFAFLAISIALLGLGAGGVLAYVGRLRLARWSTQRLGLWLCMGNSLAIVAALEIVLRVPVTLELSRRNFWKLTEIYLAAAVPFLVTGLLLAVVFARHHRRVGMLYGADLMGGALACLSVVPLLNLVGGPNAVLFAAAVMAGAAALWAGMTEGGADQRENPRAGSPASTQDSPASTRAAGVGRSFGFAVAMILLAVIAANHSGRLVDIVYAKGLRRDKPWMLFARWNAISRVEVNQVGESKYIVIDADASSAIMNVDPARWATDIPPTPKGDGLPTNPTYNWKRDLMAAAPAIANVLRPRGEFAIIGPGGGVDVLRAVANGSTNVTGIEINPIIADTIMRGRYAEYAYHLYELPAVHMHVSDGRSFLRASKDRYDVVQMTLVDTWASTAAGAFALSENNLYTVEAFREYFDHLRPDGFIAITRWEFQEPREALRVVSQAMEALHRMGVADPRAHFILVSDGPLDEDGRPVTVLAKKSPFTAEEEAAIAQHVAGNSNLNLLYAPSSTGPANAFVRLIQSNDPRGFARAYAYNVAPVDDNAPFFFFTLKAGQVLRSILSGTGRGMDWNVNLGVVVLGMLLLVMSVAAVLLFLVLPLALLQSRRAFPGQEVGHSSAIAAVLSLITVLTGYILVAVTQRFVLFLGHSTYARIVAALVMLLAAATGSMVARWWVGQAGRARSALAAMFVCVVAYIFLLRVLLACLVGLPLWIKLMGGGVLLLFLILPAVHHAKRARFAQPRSNLLAARVGKPSRMAALLYFIVIGLGYILVEVAFIQRFVLFLGHPTYALTVVVFLMLLSSGAGSIAARHWMAETSRLRVALATIVLTVLAYIFVLPLLLTAMVGLAFPLKLVISAALLVPLGFAMGMPFPTGLRAVGARTPEPVLLAGGDAALIAAEDSLVEWAWAMNAASSVLGSVLAVVIAIHFGLNATLATGAAAYVAAAAVSRRLELSRRDWQC